MVPQLIWSTTILRCARYGRSWHCSGTDHGGASQNPTRHDFHRAAHRRSTTPFEWTEQPTTCHETEVAMSQIREGYAEGMGHFEATDCVGGLLARTFNILGDTVRGTGW